MTCDAGETASRLRTLLERHGPGEVLSVGYLDGLRPGLTRDPDVAAVLAERDRRLADMRQEVRAEMGS